MINLLPEAQKSRCPLISDGSGFYPLSSQKMEVSQLLLVTGWSSELKSLVAFSQRCELHTSSATTLGPVVRRRQVRWEGEGLCFLCRCCRGLPRSVGPQEALLPEAPVQPRGRSLPHTCSLRGLPEAWPCSPPHPQQPLRRKRTGACPSERCSPGPSPTPACGPRGVGLTTGPSLGHTLSFLLWSRRCHPAFQPRTFLVLPEAGGGVRGPLCFAPGLPLPGHPPSALRTRRPAPYSPWSRAEALSIELSPTPRMYGEVPTFLANANPVHSVGRGGGGPPQKDSQRIRRNAERVFTSF